MVGFKELDKRNKSTAKLAAFSKGGMTIDQLLSQPPYCGFVEGVVFEELKFVMLLVGSDDGVALRWLWNRKYEPMSLALWSLMAKKASVIFDVGAHTGVYSMAARVANDNATVLSFEPSSLNLSRLAANLRANGLGLEYIVPAAISDWEGVADFIQPNQFEYHSTGGKIGHTKNSRSLQVQTLRLDTLYRQQKLAPSLVKIDVEEHEANVLRSMHEILSECAPDIILEAINLKTTHECTEILNEHGYRYFCIDESELSIKSVDAVVPISKNGLPNMEKINRLASKKSAEKILSLAQKARSLWLAADHLR